jgi:hypothetical protein
MQRGRHGSAGWTESVLGTTLELRINSSVGRHTLPRVADETSGFRSGFDDVRSWPRSGADERDAVEVGRLDLRAVQ